MREQRPAGRRPCDDFHLFEQRRRDDVEIFVVVGSVVRPKHLQSLLDRQVRAHDQCGRRKTIVAGNAGGAELAALSDEELDDLLRALFAARDRRRAARVDGR